MHENDIAYGVIEGHPLFAGIDAFLRRHGLKEEIVDFLMPRLCVAYPKTLWYKLLPEEPGDIRIRQTMTSSGTSGVLREWIEAKSLFRRMVFDLRGMAILDFEDLLPFLEEMRGGLPFAYVCDPPLVPLLLHHRIADASIVTSEPAMLHRIRNEASEPCIVHLPAQLTDETLDAALLAHARASRLKSAELVVLDMTLVTQLDFAGISLLAPVIHSFANRYAALTIVANTRRSVEKELNRFGFYHVMSGYLVHSYPGSAEPQSDYIFPLQAFTDAELNAIRDRCKVMLDALVLDHGPWFRAVARLTMHPWQDKVDKKAALILDFRDVIRELADNVTLHSHGLGYMMMHFDPRAGLRIYVGDTGIGLRRGLARKYRLPIHNDMEAVELALSLREHKHKRRRVHGSVSYGGRGLDRIGLILHDLRGTITIRTNGAVGVFAPAAGRRPSKLVNRRYKVHGTHLHVFIPTRSI